MTYLVLDANIVSAAGHRSTYSRGCRNVLNTIEKSEIIVVVCPILKGEWETYGGRLGLEWYSMMVRSRRAKDTECYPYRDLRRNISLCIDAGVRKILNDDVHLVEAALQHEKRIISGDLEARYHFAKEGRAWTLLADIYWAPFHETEPEEPVIDWIKNNLIENEQFRLC